MSSQYVDAGALRQASKRCSMSIAQQAIGLNLPVFPCDKQKRPIVKGGFKAATLAPDEIRGMFAARDAVMIGVPTGQASGLLVIDIDVRDGKRGLEWLADKSGVMPLTRQHQTMSGGVHILFRMPRTDVRNSASKIAPDVDVRGNGGYIIAPPSPGYEVICSAPLAECPAWLMQILIPTREKPRKPLPPIAEAGDDRARRALLRAVDAVAQSMQGGRNDALNRQAFILGMYVGAGLLDLSDVANGLFYAGRVAGLTDHEIKATLNSGLRAGQTSGGRHA